ncbi:MAG: class I SAM-dependent methyltransferase [Lentisphaerae bacterium]|nr:MAG: class I SAM-dependent methyltransferase [Lentisphaerota bacterium]
MPSSHWYQLNEIVELIVMTQPQSILDVGVGFGKYGFLCREYLELLDGRQKLHDWRRVIDGIEIFPKYITPLQKKLYTHIYIGNALDILPTLEKRYDLILLIDIIEHFDYEDGEKLLELCRERGKNIIISTPKINMPQSETFGNPYEAHKSFYKKRHFKKFPDKIFIPNPFSLIVYMGENAKSVKKGLWRRRLILTIPSHLGLLSLSKRALMHEMKRLLATGSGKNRVQHAESPKQHFTRGE